MKKALIGAVFLLSATLADIGVLISSSILAAKLTEWKNSGRMWTALVDNGMLFPFILAKILWLLGLIILTVEFLKKKEDNNPLILYILRLKIPPMVLFYHRRVLFSLSVFTGFVHNSMGYIVMISSYRIIHS